MSSYKFKASDGDIFYYKDKEMTILHREDGPAIEGDDGVYKAWYLNGERHRMGGPAIEWPDGRNSWYVDGEFIFIIDNNGKVTKRME